MTFLSQLDPVYFTNSVNKETIEKSYKSFFQIFGGEHVSLMLRGFQDYFKTRTKEEQVSMYSFMGSLLNMSCYQNAVSSSFNANSVDLRQLLETSHEGECDVLGDDEIQRIQNDESDRSIQEIVTNVMLE